MVWFGQHKEFWNNLPTDLFLMPKISSVKRHDLLLFSSVKVGILKGGIAYNIINIQCTFIGTYFGLGIVYFLTWQQRILKERNCRREVKRHLSFNLFNALIFFESAFYIRYYIMHCGLWGVLLFPGQIMNKMRNRTKYNMDEDAYLETSSQKRCF